MATSKYIRGLSGAGFRIPTNGSATAKQRVTENANVQIDLDHDKTRKILVGEKDNFIRVAASGSTTATIIGLTRYGFRIKTTANPAIKTVKLGSGVHTVDITDGRVRRVLRRNYGRFLFTADANKITIRGIVDKQTGFDIKGTAGFKPVTITNANPTNVNDEDEVVVGAITYAFETALTEVFATDTVTTSGTPSSTRASGTITSPAATGAGNGSTIQIGGTTYTFKTTLSSGPTVPNEILRDGTRGNDLTNLVDALTNGVGGGNVGVKYSVGTAARTDVSLSAVASNATTVTAASYNAVVGNAIALVAGGGTPVTVSGATLASGVNETINVNGHTYTFVEALTTAATGGVTANEVLISGQDVSLDNFQKAVNGSAGAGTNYSTGTVANTDATCGNRSTHTVTLKAITKVAATGNALTLAVVGAHLSRATATFTGGVDPVANEVLVGGSADASLTNLSEAINAGANVGVDYSTGTVVNAAASASAVASHAITLTPKQGGGQTLVVTESTSGARLTVNDATLEEPLVRVYEGVSATVDPQDPQVYTQLRRHFKSYVEA